MILLEPIVEIGTAAVGDVLTQGLADGARVGIMSIGRHPIRSIARGLDRLIEERRGAVHVPVLTQLSSHEIAVTINRTIEGAPRPVAFDVNGTIINDKFCMTRWIERPRLGRGHAVLPHHTSR